MVYSKFRQCAVTTTAAVAVADADADATADASTAASKCLHNFLQYIIRPNEYFNEHE